MLRDGTFGQITFQSPEMVRLKQPGGETRVFSPTEIISLAPKVLSNGFRIMARLGLDYKHQAHILDAVPERLKKHVEDDLSSNGITGDSLNLKVEFEQAGASSLDIAIIADFSGQHASTWDSLPRRLQQSCLKACNENKWEIPFNQLTVHMEQ